MPPMLDISLLELTGSTEEEVLAHETRLGVDERHYVLQLIAETEGAPRLVISAARPKAARQSLVQEPARGQEIDGLVGCFDIYCAERVIPVLPARFKRAARGSRSTKASQQGAGVSCLSPCAEPEAALTLLSVGQLD